MLGSWNIGPSLLGWIRNNIDPGSKILELGSGKGSEVLSGDYTVYSVEHGKKWLDKYDTNYIYAPIKNGWYDLTDKELPDYYSLLLVDGPPGNIGRSKMLAHLDLFYLECPIIVDDTHRKSEQYLANRLSAHLGREPRHFTDHHNKEFAVI